MENLQMEAEKLLEKMRLVPPREPSEKLRPSDEARILDLAAQGWTQERIAGEIACHQSTVSRTLAEYDDSRPLARRYLNARAIKMAQRFVEEARPSDVLRMMGKLDVIRDDGAPGAGANETYVMLGVGVQMNTVRDDGTRKTAAELFAPNDVIILEEHGSPVEAPTLQLGVLRRLPGVAHTSYALPCSVSEIPPHVKVEPEAASFIRESMESDNV
jgi:Homeodomain-like domain